MFWRVFLEFVLFFSAISLMIFFALGFFRHLFSQAGTGKPSPLALSAPLEVQTLYLDNETLQTLTGIQYLHFLRKNLELNIFMLGSTIALILAVISLFTVTEQQTGLWAFALVLLVLLGTGVLMFYRQQHRKKHYKHLFALLQEVDNFNKTLHNILVLDKLQSVGNPVDLNDREQILAALKIIHTELIRALNTEKILRENPTFNPEEFHCDLTTLHALQVNKDTSEYGKLLDIALQVGLSIHDKMRDFIQERQA
ncbi:hypothetical protein BegalDRAFT_0605 [Beggiatoa alba B18LD]|uniref:Uncharacterized protein n=1 Tax=Beggiatoa alba B18LD TaxID=395493 RepID=I3CD27_9GAMM|nr:hypothetical protein [Beggiatoa alba]EIJ41520.1 hypothetical protein BegalDRAFT_0605 [Beggiatoa alba B18LD]